MQVELSPELEQLVQTLVNSGRYNSPNDVLSHALQLLELLDTTSSPFALALPQIRDEVEAGWQSAQRGELVDADEVFDRIDAELNSLAHVRAK